eukprot:1533227-Heterocapsa_arctica.AAC.1
MRHPPPQSPEHQGDDRRDDGEELAGARFAKRVGAARSGRSGRPGRPGRAVLQRLANASKQLASTLHWEEVEDARGP